ncbi:MAG: hypothetical protein HQK58_15585 [Deltaproteobacteria bacterium]|nr:hypothetical protein [Deltaproteobacteria bacterium]MBF0527213.1 hypothetical protein [Deltaproteobacteria bacterium]
MKRSILVLGWCLITLCLSLPLCHAGTTWTGCVYDTNYPNTKYNYTVEQPSGAAYATIRGTVANTTASQDAFPGTMNGFIESSTSKIHFTIVYRNNWGSRFYVIDRAGAGTSWAVDATGAIYDAPHSIQVQTCPAGDEPSNNAGDLFFSFSQGNR